MIRIVCIGKVKKEWKEINNEFLKRIRKFCKIEIIEIKEDKQSEIEKYIKGFSVILDENGKEIASKEFAKLISLHDKITFIIGGKKGLSDEIKKKANFILSLSKMTFSHQLARIILLEQIYRGFCIIKNLPYAKDV